MSLPYHRNNTNSMATQRGGSGYGNRDKRAEEANRLLLEQENEARLMELGEHVSLLKSVYQI
jgi:hypothetical protein